MVLEDGRELVAPVVASSVDPHWTFERFLEPGELPEEFLAAVRRIDYSIGLGQGEPGAVRAAAVQLPGSRSGAEGVGPHHHGTMHIGPTLEYLERAYDDAKYGRYSHEPILEMTMPTSVDRTIAPPGQHIVSMFVQYAPYQLAEGDWDSQREAFGDRCIEVLARYAPNVPGAILHRQVLTPLDLERTYGLTGGNIFQGAMSLSQLVFAAARRRLGRPSHADRRPVPVRRSSASWRRSDGSLRQERGGGDSARRLAADGVVCGDVGDNAAAVIGLSGAVRGRMMRGTPFDRTLQGEVVMRRLSLLLMSCMLLPSQTRAVDLSAIRPKMVALPEFEGSEALRVARIRPRRRQRIWLVCDGDVLYADRNGNGDLTEPDERVGPDAKTSRPKDGVLNFFVGDIADGPLVHKGFAWNGSTSII